MAKLSGSHGSERPWGRVASVLPSEAGVQGLRADSQVGNDGAHELASK